MEESKKNGRGCFFWSSIFFLLLILISLGIFWWGWSSITQPKNPNSTDQTLLSVEEGTSVNQVASDLAELEIIKSSLAFRLAVFFQSASVKPGLYYVSQSASIWEIVAELSEGKVAEEKITTLEGWRTEEIAQYLVDEDILSEQGRFYEALGESFRGKLFPDTYRVETKSDPVAIVKKMRANFSSRVADLNPTEEELILASIVEREALFDEDRAEIAGVYRNRLDIGMKLDADPTVQFAKATLAHPDCVAENFASGADCDNIDWWPEISRSDYQAVGSPSNTYLNPGLPPTPICNPGLASIKAAVAPADHDFYYFVTDSEGRAHFAKNLAEHNQNVANFK